MTKLTCFKAYDVRGKLGPQINADIAYRIGRAFAQHMNAKNIVVGGDVRLTSEELKLATARGIMDAGAMGHAPYRFSVVIENSQSTGYFTEKLIDAVLCRSIPIYWGDPEISQYFDTRGMIICNSLGDFIEALNSINNETYEAMAPYVEINRARAQATFDLPNSMTKIAGPHIYDKSVQFGAK